MPVLDVHGVRVDFPFQLYDCQKELVWKVIECLQKVRFFFILHLFNLFI
jgi:hypothetical protein